jgi:preprotein translocase subunit SecD
MRLDVKAFTYSWFSLWVVIALIGIYFLYPLRKTLRLGIDLVGGTYITLQVHTDKAVEAALLEHMQTLANRLEVGLKIAPLSRNVEKGKLIFIL